MRSGDGSFRALAWLMFVSVCVCTSAPAAEPGFNAGRAFGYLQQVCELGPRISGTQGMTLQQELIEKHFSQFACRVSYQDFDVAHPQSGEPVRMRNMIVSWHPDSRERILLACHYDTRPRPDRELLPFNRDKPFIGANDGASGVAFFMELGHHMASVPSRYGVDFVFFDGEELVYDAKDKYFHGSEYFATAYRDTPPAYRYVAGVLVDMIADKKLTLYQERFSLRYAGGVTRSIWETAGRLGERAFVARPKHELNDDHIPLNEIARIPTCDIIDFDYPYWHTRNDLPAACSGESLKTVARVIVAWLQTYQAP